MEGLENLVMLEELWLGRNKIREINLSGLFHLKKISVQSNRLTTMKGFEVNFSQKPSSLWRDY